MGINCYPLIFKKRVIKCYYCKKYKVYEILKIFGISRGSLYNWVNKYNNDELFEKKQYNKISKYNNKIRQYIINYVLKRVNFDYKKLIRIIKTRFKINCKKSSIYQILKSNNITRKRVNVKTIYHKKSRSRRLKRELSKKIKISGIDKIISIDESSFDAHINAHYGWNKKGSRLTVRKRRQRIRYSIISAISIDKVISVKIVKGSINSHIFIEFIKDIIVKIKDNNVLFMDNARIHHSKLFNAYMKTCKNKVLYNVPYCSELNPIEMVFSKVKHIVHKRGNNENTIKLKRNIKYGFNKITKSDLRGYYTNSLIF